MTESAPLTCPKHPKAETYLRCAACNTPICEKCRVQTPVGFKCRDCGTYKHAALYKPSFFQALAVFGTGLAGGLIGSLILTSIGFFGIWLAIIYGRFLGTLILRVSGRKLGTLIDVLTGCSIIIGCVTTSFIFNYVTFHQFITHLHVAAPSKVLAPIAIFGVFSFYGLIISIAIAAAAISRTRFTWSAGWF